MESRELIDTLNQGLAGHYRIDSVLGKGGMAIVLRALDLRHERQVAIKVLEPHLAALIGADRFLREIRFAARLQHPNILTVLESGETAGILWYSMPLIEGESLRERLMETGPLPLEEALRITREVADALGYIHAHGVIHRDIKPGNILFSGPHALVADFGIARLTTPATEELTQTGAVVGTPAYMSPEQAAADRALDARTDIYALGGVLYEMLTGSIPSGGGFREALLGPQPSSPKLSVRAKRPEVPRRIDAAIRRALSPDPADRPATMEAFVAALDGSRPAGGGFSRLFSGRMARLALLVIGVAGLAALGWLLLSPHHARPIRLAVIPFQNEGPAGDEYFATGFADAIRGRLAGVGGLAVIASASSDLYKGLTRPLKQIGAELGVEYLLVGKVRREGAVGADSGRVLIIPELVLVRGQTTLWTTSLEAPMTGIFGLQASVVGRILQALRIAGAAAAIDSTPPTRSTAAYEAFLRAEDQTDRVTTFNPAALRAGMNLYRRAVELDSGFALGWARLGEAASTHYINSAGADAADRSEAARAVARAEVLDPAGVATLRARAAYLQFITGDQVGAYDAAIRGLEREPRQSELLTVAATVGQRLGRWSAAVEQLRLAAELDPRSQQPRDYLAFALLYLRQYAEAERVSREAVRRDSTDLTALLNLSLALAGQGRRATAVELVRHAVGHSPGPDGLIAFMAQNWDLYWLLDDSLQLRLLRLTPAAFDGNQFSWGLALAGTSAMRGDSARARALADSARVAVEDAIKQVPDSEWRRPSPVVAQFRLVHGVALAYLGRRAEAVAEGQYAVQAIPLATEALYQPYFPQQLARIYLLLGDNDRALDLLEQLLRIPYFVSGKSLAIDPTFAPLWANPRFQAIVARP